MSKIYFYRNVQGNIAIDDISSLGLAFSLAKNEHDNGDSSSQIVIDLENRKMYLLELTWMTTHIQNIEKQLDINSNDFQKIDAEYFQNAK